MSTQDQEKTAQELWDELDAEESIPPSSSGDAREQRDPEPAPEKQEGTPTEPEAGDKPAPVQKVDDASQPTARDDEIAGLKAIVDQFQHRLRQSEGKLGELNSTLKQSMAAAQNVRAGGGDAPSAAEIRAAQGSTAAMERLRQDYPEFAAAIEEVVSSARQDPGELASVREQLAQTQRELDVTRRKMVVEVRHPGWEEDVKTPLFAGWLQRQPPEVRMLADSDEPAAAIRVMDLFKQVKEQVAAARQNTEAFNAAAALPGARRAPGRPKSVDEMTDAEYWAHLDEQERLNRR